MTSPILAACCAAGDGRRPSPRSRCELTPRSRGHRRPSLPRCNRLDGQAVVVQDDKGGESRPHLAAHDDSEFGEAGGPKGAIQFPFLADGELLACYSSPAKATIIAINRSPRVFTRCDTAFSRSMAIIWASAPIAITFFCFQRRRKSAWDAGHANN